MYRPRVDRISGGGAVDAKKMQKKKIWRVYLVPGGVLSPSQGVCLVLVLGCESAQGGVPGPGGVGCLPGGVSAWGVSAQGVSVRGVPGPGGVSAQGGVPGPGGV